MKENKVLLRICLLVVSLLINAHSYAQVIRVTGTVVDENDQALQGVNINDVTSKRLIAVTDGSGKYAVNVMSGGYLKFSFVGFKTKTIHIKSQTNIDVKMESSSDVKLKEVQVLAKRIIKKVVAEPTKIEVVGQFFHVRTRIRVPKQLFNANCRLVVQPVLHDLTSRKDVNMKPLVFDGREYNRTQNRMYDFDIAKDSLSPYITVKSKATHANDSNKLVEGDIIAYHDSVYVKNVRHSFSCDVFMAIENYVKIVYGDTTTIANGTVNPLRFLDYDFASSIITDTAYLPKGEMQLRDGKGEIKLVFPIGSSKLDAGNETNKSELARLNSQLKEIENGNGTQLRDLQIQGMASPDGSYKYNLKLAKDRMRSSLDMIVSQLNPETRKGLRVSSDAKVASWKDLIDILEKDSMKRQYEDISYLVSKNKGDQSRYAAIRKLPYYNSILEGKYLPRLRKSEYSYMYTLYRHLTIDEINELYKKDYKQLSRYEFWKLYNSKSTPAEKEKICGQALSVYPSFMVAANDLAVCQINRKEYNDSILEPFAGPKAPKEVNMNQIINLIECGSVAKADTLTDYVPETGNTRLLKAFARAMDGKYNENYETIASTGKFNEALMLLAMKQNSEALKTVEQMPTTDAMTYYLKATCLNRLDRPNEAYEALKKAFEMNPSLKSVAKADGDVNDLLPKDDNLTNE